MQIVFSIVGIIITIFFVIGTHEAAHFAVARLFGVKVLRFSIGFGKRIFAWHDRKGTEYVVAWIPLGGYVKMLDESEGNVAEADKKYAYNRQPFYKKFLIILAGPLANIVCAICLYWLIFLIGFVTIKPIIGEVVPNSIAAQAGLKSKQEIVELDKKPIHSWLNVIFRVILYAGDEKNINVVVKSPNSEQTQSHSLNLATWKMDPLKPDPLLSLGIKPYAPEIPMIIGVVAPSSPATDKLKVGDKIIAIDKLKVNDWENFILYIYDRPNQTVHLTIERDGKQQMIPLTLGSKRSMIFSKKGYLGVAPNLILPKELIRKVQYGPWDALKNAIQEIYNFTYLNLLLFGKILTGKLSLQSLGGPITIFESAGSALNVGIVAFLGFLAFLSISIGVINLLPIPGLDGGHLFFQIIEAIIRRPIPEKILAGFYYAGFMLLFFVLFQAVLNDILRLY